MVDFAGVLRTRNERDTAIRVVIDLADERLRLRSGDTEIADWSLNDIRVSAHSDGFHVTAEGEEIILELSQDAEFAVALGLRSAPIGLARRMSMVRDRTR
jgi:regulation of enolase protein 1 (concanavalin A-like superfamily)